MALENGNSSVIAVIFLTTGGALIYFTQESTSMTISAGLLVDGTISTGAGTAGLATSGAVALTGVGTVPAGVTASASELTILKGLAEITVGASIASNTINNMNEDANSDSSSSSNSSNNETGAEGSNDLNYENPGHHDPSGNGPNSYNKTKSVLPENHKELWDSSLADPKKSNLRWTKEGSGKKATYHRFQSDGNGNWHWNGSTNGATQSMQQRNININHVPNEIKKL